MKICLICPEIGNFAGSAFIGGGVNNVVRLSKALANRGHKVTIITTPHRHPGDNQGASLPGVEVFCLPISASYLSARYGIQFAMRTWRKVNKLQAVNKFSIIHGHSGYSMLALITGIASRMGHIPSIHSIYSPISSARGNNLVRFSSNKVLSRFYFSQINRIIAVSNNVQRSLINSGVSAQKIELMPPAIDTSVYNPSISGDEVRNQLNIKQDDYVLSYVGNLTKQKGLHILLPALSIITKRFPDTKLLMVLNMPLSRYETPGKLEVDMGLTYEIKDMIESYGLNNNVIPIGLSDRLPQIIASSDIFVSPFLNTIGIMDYPASLLEAMATGKPVIATRVGGIPEIVSPYKNGLLINRGNPSELADAIVYMLENGEEAKRMGAEGAKIISRNFNIEIIVDKLEQIYEAVSKG